MQVYTTVSTAWDACACMGTKLSCHMILVGGFGRYFLLQISKETVGDVDVLRFLGFWWIWWYILYIYKKIFVNDIYEKYEKMKMYMYINIFDLYIYTIFFLIY